MGLGLCAMLWPPVLLVPNFSSCCHLWHSGYYMFILKVIRNQCSCCPLVACLLPRAAYITVKLLVTPHVRAVKFVPPTTLASLVAPRHRQSNPSVCFSRIAEPNGSVVDEISLRGRCALLPGIDEGSLHLGLRSSSPYAVVVARGWSLVGTRSRSSLFSVPA